MDVMVIHKLPLHPSELFAIKHRKFTFIRSSGFPAPLVNLPCLYDKWCYCLSQIPEAHSLIEWCRVTAMGPPRILTVFRDDKTHIILFREGVKCQPVGVVADLCVCPDHGCNFTLIRSTISFNSAPENLSDTFDLFSSINLFTMLIRSGTSSAERRNFLIVFSSPVF